MQYSTGRISIFITSNYAETSLSISTQWQIYATTIKLEKLTAYNCRVFAPKKGACLNYICRTQKSIIPFLSNNP